MRIAGVVLTGGASRRMGRTKATIDVEGRAMADRVLDALRDVGASPLVLVGGDAEELGALSAPLIDDEYPGTGPVGGLLTALEHLSSRHESMRHEGRPDDVPGADVDAALVLACDLADVTGEALWPIVEAAAGDGRSLVWVAATDRLEPMCALWSLAARGIVRERFAAGERALHSLIAELPHTTVTVDGAALRNVNRPADLRVDERDR